MIIDSHAHVYPADYLDRLERIGVDPATTQVARDLRASSEPEDIAARLRQMDDAGVDVQVLSVDVTKKRISLTMRINQNKK